MNIKILNAKEKKRILNKLNEQFGIEKIPGQIIMRGKERLFLYSGYYNESQIKELSKISIIERIGVYFGKIIQDREGEKIRLSIEGSQIFSKQITKNIFELPSEEDVEEWMLGRELLIKTGKRDFLVMKYKNDFLGTGKASQEKITNFIPKNRRLREKNG